MLDSFNFDVDEVLETGPERGQVSSRFSSVMNLKELPLLLGACCRQGKEFMALRIQLARLKFQLHRVLPLRYRYIFSPSGRVRLRYSLSFYACVAAAFTLSLYPLTQNVRSFVLHSGSGAVVAQADSGTDSVLASSRLPTNPELDGQMRSRLSETMRMASSLIQKPKKPRSQSIEIGSGETIAGVLQEAGISGADSYKALKALSKHYDPRDVKAGQILNIEFKPNEVASKNSEEEVLDFAKLSMKLSPVKEVVVKREGEGENAEFSSVVQEKELEQHTYGRFAKIETSLYGSAAKAGIPSGIIAELIRIYSWNVDFQRDIRSGDKIEVLYEAYETEDGDFAKYGNVLYASLSVGGKDIPIYRYELPGGGVDFFEPNGQSIKKTLMKTPIDGARISSGFGMRKHPVLGYNKMHKGMDFAAPTGTPIYAAGDGTITYAGRKGSYGNYVQIRHNSTLKTAYAHMHRFGKGMASGKRVKQGEVIGYVGTTGRSTGAHLHYEVLLNGTQVNPNRVDLPTGEQLAGKDLKKFKAHIGDVHQQYVELTQGMKFAQLAE